MCRVFRGDFGCCLDDVGVGLVGRVDFVVSLGNEKKSPSKKISSILGELDLDFKDKPDVLKISA